MTEPIKNLAPLPEYVAKTPDLYAINKMNESGIITDLREVITFKKGLKLNSPHIETPQTNPDNICVGVRIGDAVIPVKSSLKSCLITLKTALAPQIGINPKDQVLIFRGTKLQDTKSLENQSISDKSTLLLKHRLSFKITIKVLNPKGKVIWRLRVKPRLEVGHLKAKLERMTNMKMTEQVLTFENTPLQDKFHLDSYGIINKSKIVLQSQLSFKVDIVVRNLDTNEDLHMKIKPRLKVLHMKERIEKMSGVKASNQRLQVIGYPTDLSSDAPLTDCHIDDKQVVLLKPQKVDVQIFNNSTGELQFTFSVTPESKVKYVKKKIQEVSGIRRADQVLRCNKELKDYLPLKHYAITDKDKIFLINLKERIDIHVAVADFLDIFRFSVKPRLMVCHLKDKIKRETDIDVKEQILIVGEEVLRDNDTLYQSGIDQDSEIILRQRQFLSDL